MVHPSRFPTKLSLLNRAAVVRGYRAIIKLLPSSTHLRARLGFVDKAALLAWELGARPGTLFLICPNGARVWIWVFLRTESLNTSRHPGLYGVVVAISNWAWFLQFICSHLKFVRAGVVQAALSINAHDLLHLLDVLQHLTSVLLSDGSIYSFVVLRRNRRELLIHSGRRLLLCGRLGLFEGLLINALFLMTARFCNWIEGAVHRLDLGELLSFVSLSFLFGSLLCVRHNLLGGHG